MKSIAAKLILAGLLLSGLVPIARGQISVEEAERRLKEKLATRPTRPTTEVDRLREENRRLREEVVMLEQEVTTLKEIIARASRPTTRPATQPVEPDNPDAAQKTLLGRWRGGDITAGTGYLLQFDGDGVYKQTFIVNNAKETGQYRMIDDNTMEMWSAKWPENKKHNRYQVTLAPGRITLTPLVQDGFEVKTAARVVVLRRAD